MQLTVAVVLLASAGTAVAQVGAWGQCGGNGYTGPKNCASGNCCTASNQWYSQCIPGNCGGGGNPQPTTTRAAQTTTRTGNNPAATTFCGQYDLVTTSNGYNVINNLWGKDKASSGSQCTWFNSASGNSVSWGSQWNWSGGQNDVKSYPYAGKNFSPKLVSQVSSLPTTYSWSYSGSNIRANVAYDLFTSANRNNPTYTGDYELMIWLAAYGGVGPISATGQPIATVNLAGHSWRLYYGLNGAMKVYSFVYANGMLNSFSGDVKAFFNLLVSQYQFPQNNQYLLTFQAGTEPFTGGPATLQVSSFSATVN